jgi:hypothetical protein
MTLVNGFAYMMVMLMEDFCEGLEAGPKTKLEKLVQASDLAFNSVVSAFPTRIG